MSDRFIAVGLTSGNYQLDDTILVIDTLINQPRQLRPQVVARCDSYLGAERLAGFLSANADAWDKDVSQADEDEVPF